MKRLVDVIVVVVVVVIIVVVVVVSCVVVVLTFSHGQNLVLGHHPRQNRKDTFVPPNPGK